MSTSLLLWGVLFSSVGFGYFLFGKKQKRLVPLVCGIAMMVLPYLFDSAMLLVIVGAAVAAVPYFIRR